MNAFQVLLQELSQFGIEFNAYKLCSYQTEQLKHLNTDTHTMYIIIMTMYNEGLIF